MKLISKYLKCKVNLLLNTETSKITKNTHNDKRINQFLKRKLKVNSTLKIFKNQIYTKSNIFSSDKFIPEYIFQVKTLNSNILISKKLHHLLIFFPWRSKAYFLIIQNCNYWTALVLFCLKVITCLAIKSIRKTMKPILQMQPYSKMWIEHLFSDCASLYQEINKGKIKIRINKAKFWLVFWPMLRHKRCERIKILKAKKTMKTTVIGLVILFLQPIKEIKIYQQHLIKLAFYIFY